MRMTFRANILLVICKAIRKSCNSLDILLGMQDDLSEIEYDGFHICN